MRKVYDALGASPSSHRDVPHILSALSSRVKHLTKHASHRRTRGQTRANTLAELSAGLQLGSILLARTGTIISSLSSSQPRPASLLSARVVTATQRLQAGCSLLQTAQAGQSEKEEGEKRSDLDPHGQVLDAALQIALPAVEAAFNSGGWVAEEGSPKDVVGVLEAVGRAGYGGLFDRDTLDTRGEMTLRPVVQAGNLPDVRDDHAAVVKWLGKGKGKWRRLLPHRRKGGRMVPSAGMRELSLGLPLDRLERHVSDGVDLVRALAGLDTDDARSVGRRVLNRLAMEGMIPLISGDHLAEMTALDLGLDGQDPFAEQCLVEASLFPSRFQASSRPLLVRSLAATGVLAFNEAVIASSSSTSSPSSSSSSSSSTSTSSSSSSSRSPSRSPLLLFPPQ